MKKQLMNGYSITQDGKYFFLFNNKIDINPVYTAFFTF